MAVLPAYAGQLHVPAEYPSIQSAMRAAADGDVVIVSAGIYEEQIDFLGKAITVQSVASDDAGIVAATVIEWMVPDEPAVRFCSGETRGSILRGMTVRGDWISARIVAEGSSPTIEGSRIEGGVNCEGGSPCVRSSSLMWLGCRESTPEILSNKFAGWRAAVNADHASPLIVGNEFKNCSQGYSGAVIRVLEAQSDGGGPIIADNLFESNLSSVIILCDGYMGVVVHGNSIIGNVTDIAMWVFPHGYPSLVENNVVACNQWAGELNLNPIAIAGVGCPIISGNTVSCNDMRGIGGDGLQEMTGNIVVGNVGMGVAASGEGLVFAANTICGNGGLGASLWRNRLIVEGNVVADNKGGGMSAAGMLSNNTIVNPAGCVSPALSCPEGTVRNCVIASPSSPAISSQPFSVGVLSLSHNLIAGGRDWVVSNERATIEWGAGNIDADPRFVRPGRWDDAGTPEDASDDIYVPGDYRLLPGSPCIDAGTNDVDNPDTTDVETLPPTDLAGVKRIIDGDFSGTATVDIGAYEFLPGDADGDGRVNLLDMLRIRNSLGLDPSSSPDARLADVNGDGSVNMVDLLLARRQFQSR